MVCFLTEEEVNLPIDKAVPVNNIRSNVFDGEGVRKQNVEILKLVFVTFSLGLNSVQQSLN